MENQFRFFQIAEVFEVKNAAFHKPGFRDVFDVFDSSAGKIVVDCDIGWEADEFSGEVKTDEARATCNENFRPF